MKTTLDLFKKKISDFSFIFIPFLLSTMPFPVSALGKEPEGKARTEAAGKARSIPETEKNLSDQEELQLFRNIRQAAEAQKQRAESKPRAKQKGNRPGLRFASPRKRVVSKNKNRPSTADGEGTPRSQEASSFNSTKAPSTQPNINQDQGKSPSANTSGKDALSAPTDKKEKPSAEELAKKEANEKEEKMREAAKIRLIKERTRERRERLRKR